MDEIEFVEDVSPITRIKVIGVGGGGGNAVNTMITAGIEGVEFIVANTDAQALSVARAPIKIQMGAAITRGLGAGADPEVARQAALEDTSAIADALTHVGQIAMLRRLAGSPVRAENYSRAEVQVGRVGLGQAEPRREFD